MYTDYEEKELKSYKGYEISKLWKLNFFGKRVGKPFYCVAEGGDYIGEEYKTLEEAKEFIDMVAR